MQDDWLGGLEARVARRSVEAEVLSGVLVRAADELRAANGRVIDEFQVGAIRLTDVRLQSAGDPMHEPFEVEGVSERIHLRDLFGPELERWAGLDVRPLDAEERLALSLLRYRDGRYEAALDTLRSGDLPAHGPAGTVGPELRNRVFERAEHLTGRRERREQDAQAHLSFIFDVKNQEHSPSNVVARIEALLEGLGDTDAVRGRSDELRLLRQRLRAERSPALRDEFRDVFRPTHLEYPERGRVKLSFDFEDRSVGAWRRGDWIFDARGWIQEDSAKSWEALIEMRAPKLLLGPPLKLDDFTVRVRFERAFAGPAKLFYLEAAGVGVALVGTGLPASQEVSRTPGTRGAEGGGRFLLATGSTRTVLERVRAGEGVPMSRELAFGEPHTLVLRCQRRLGRIRLELDGELLDEATLGFKARKSEAPQEPWLELRAWEPIRILSATLEAGR